MDSIFNVAVILKAIDYLTEPLRQAAKQLETVDAMAKRARGMVDFGQKMTVGGALMTGAAGQMTGMLQEIIKPSTEVQDALAKVGTVITPMSGTVADAVDRMKRAGVEWSLAHRDSAAKFIDTTYEMASSKLR
jgi:hypothetical protein